VGIPLIMLEVSLGIKVRAQLLLPLARLTRGFRGSVWQPLNSLVILVYYSVIIGWALNYIVFSFTQAWEVTLIVSSTSPSWA